VAQRHAAQPKIWPSYGSPGRAKSVRDAGCHLDYPVEALEAGAPRLFATHLVLVKILFAGQKFPESILPSTVACTRQTLIEQLPTEACSPAFEVLLINTLDGTQTTGTTARCCLLL
jgi:hypothetical protein